MKKYLLRFETFAVGAIALFSGLFLYQTYQYGRRAALFPRIISLTVLFLTAVFFYSRVRRIRKQTGASETTVIDTNSGRSCDGAEKVSWIVTLSVATAFLVLIYLIGFGPATFFYVPAHLYISGYRRHKVIFGFALAMAILMVGSGYLFSIPLPQGVLIESILETTGR